MKIRINNPIKLVCFCDSYEEDIDIIYNKSVIDAKSILGVEMFAGYDVEIYMHTDDERKREEFERMVRELQ